MAPEERHPGASREQEGMRHVLDVASAHLPEPDLAETTWRRGRRVRRQRHLATAVGGVAAVAVVAAGWAALGERLDASPAGDADPTGVLSEAAPQLPEHERRVEAEGLWAGLRASCLEAQGLRAWVSEDGRGVSVQRPDVRGLPGVREARQQCDDLLVLRVPWVELLRRSAEEVERAGDAARSERDRLGSEGRAELGGADEDDGDGGEGGVGGAGEEVTVVPREEVPPETSGLSPFDSIHVAYGRATTCLRHNGLPWEPRPMEDFLTSFVDLNGSLPAPGETFVPPWHPYAAALEEDGTVEEALAVCPVNRYLVEPETQSTPIPGAGLTP